jgi:hypothetical protein
VPASASPGSVAGNGVFALFIAGLIVSGMALLLLLNTTLAEGAFQIQALSAAQQQLQVSQQTLLLYVARNESPDALARQATKLGMVPVTSPAFLRLSDGAILGSPVPAAMRKPAAAPAKTTGVTAAPSSDGAVNMTAVPGATGAAAATTPTDGAALVSATGATKAPVTKTKPAATKPKAGPTAGALR